jgi:2-isopropylmalate synthase
MVAPCPSSSDRYPNAGMTNQVRLYDTTLRDGMQREGINLSVSEKLQVAHLIDRLGTHLIEAGFPASNPKDQELFDRLADERFGTARVAAFGMTRRRDVAAERDDALVVLASCFAPVVTLVGKTWDLHLTKVVHATRDENLAMIRDSIAFLAAQGKDVMYDAEHFFDAYAADGDYALRCVTAAAEAGASTVTLCDTNGASLPSRVADATARVVAALGPERVGIHTHNDAECAVACSLAAVEAGARLVQGTINGIGERCGNANLIALLPSLQVKLGYDCVEPDRLRHLTEISHAVAEILNLQPDAHAAYVGRAAFAHKGGMHIAGVAADARTFEHIDPQLVGNSRSLIVSELSGKGTIREKAAEFGVNLDTPGVTRALDRLKALEHQGYAFEAADASFELLVRGEAGQVEPLFGLESLRVITEKRSDGRVETEATIKLWVGSERVVETAEGNGPVNALDAALRGALATHYPQLGQLELANYKVRILNPHTGTGAVTRVILDTTNGHDEWSTVGVSANIIEASWHALVESLTYGVRLRPAQR